MPEYEGKKYPYTAQGMKAFIKAKRKKKKKGQTKYPHLGGSGDGGPTSGGGGVR